MKIPSKKSACFQQLHPDNSTQKLFVNKGFQDTFATVKETITIPKSEYEKLRREHEMLRLELQKLKKLIFGSKSERFISKDPDQLKLFDEVKEQEASQQQEEKITYTRKKSEGKAKRTVELPSHLIRKIEVIEPELPEGEKGRKIGVEVTETLEYIPGKMYVRRIERPKYVVEIKDESGESQEKIAIADLPAQVIRRGNAGASLLAYIFVSKFVDHLPFYRQRMIFKRQKIDISPSTIGGWMNQCCKLLEGLYHCLVEQVKNSDYIQGDESPIKVQSGHKKGATHQGYMWVYNDPLHKNVVFEYNPTRSQTVPVAFFKGVNAVVQTDGYNAYNILEKSPDMNITLHACMAHARRKFIEAKSNDEERAEKALVYIQSLYEIERQIKEDELDDEKTKSLRQNEAIPVLDEFKSWLDDTQHKVLPKSSIGKAIAYTLNLWPRLIKYTEEGKYRIDNNLVENAIRPLALGRKNYLFAGSHDAAQRAAMMYSLFASCKVAQIDPYQWLEEVLSVIGDHNHKKLNELLPSNERFKKFAIQTENK